MPQDLAALNNQALAAARRAVEQVESKVPVDATCPDCHQLISVSYIEPPSDSFITKCKCQRSNKIMRGILGPPDWVLRSREYSKGKALKHSLLDAMFFVEHFNDAHGTYFQCPLAVADIFPGADAADAQRALLRSQKLNRGQNAFVGEAFFESPEAFAKAVKNLKIAHPGFCEDVYEIVIQDNIRGMR
jgi:hypothetical protein